MVVFEATNVQQALSAVDWWQLAIAVSPKNLAE